MLKFAETGLNPLQSMNAMMATLRTETAAQILVKSKTDMCVVEAPRPPQINATLSPLSPLQPSLLTLLMSS